jgi:hypothetical protein
MFEDEVPAVIAQVRKVLELMRTHRRGPLSEDQQLEFSKLEALFESMVSHRGPGYPMTEEQALELATLMKEVSDQRESMGLPETPVDELVKGANRLLNLPKPVKN